MREIKTNYKAEPNHGEAFTLTTPDINIQHSAVDT